MYVILLKKVAGFNMLKINKRKRFFGTSTVLKIVGVLLFAGGAYLLSLLTAPLVAPVIATKPIDAKSLPAPTENRVIIPKLGVNIPYGEGQAALDRGAEWRFPDRGNPETGGNFIIAAHRFSIQPTLSGTIEKSPFYNIDKLVKGDKILIDYNNKRFAYEISDEFTAKPDQTEIENPSSESKLTLYTCTLNGAADGRVVLISKRLGEVALTNN